MEVVEGVHRIEEASDNPAYANVYLHISGGELTVIDTGTAGNAGKIVEYVEHLGRKPSDIKTIIITHYHADHTGSVRELKELTGARIAASAEEADFISGKKPLPKPVDDNHPTDVPFDTVEVDVVLGDGDTIAGLKVILTPGHTLGSIMVLDESRKVLFAGDTLRFQGSALTGAHQEYTQDWDRMMKSIVKASKQEFDIMLPGHGAPLTVDACGEVRRTLCGGK